MIKFLNIFICGVVILILGIFFLYPKYQNLQLLRTEASQKEFELQYKEEYFTRLKDIGKELEQYQEGLSKIDSALPDALSLPALFDFFQKTTSENGLLLENINFSSVSKSSSSRKAQEVFQESLSGVQGICFSLDLSGSYSAFQNFLLALEKSARLWEPESFSFSLKLDEEQETPNFSFNLHLKTHSY